MKPLLETTDHRYLRRLVSEVTRVLLAGGSVYAKTEDERNSKHVLTVVCQHLPNAARFSLRAKTADGGNYFMDPGSFRCGNGHAIVASREVKV